MSAATLDAIADAVAAAGPLVRGGFHPAPADRVAAPPDGRAAEAVGAHPIFANEGPPYPPIQDWARRRRLPHRPEDGRADHLR